MGVCHSAPCTDVLLQQPVAERRHCREQLRIAMEIDGGMNVYACFEGSGGGGDKE